MTDQQNLSQPQPQPQPQAPGQQYQAAQPKKRKRGIAIGTAIAGGVIVLGALGTAAFWMAGLAIDASTFNQSQSSAEGGGEYTGPQYAQEDGPGSWSVTTDMTGVRSVDVDAAASVMTVQFADVDVATLSVEGDYGNRWMMYVDEDELQIERRGNVNPLQARTAETVTLLLPEMYNGKLNSDVTVGAGDLSINGDFAELDLNVDAGLINYTGTAATLDLEVGVGDATVDVSNVRALDVSVSVGQATIAVAGKQPQSVEVSTEIGSVNVTLPQGAYRLDTRADLGDISSALVHDPASTHLVTARASVGEIVLR